MLEDIPNEDVSMDSAETAVQSDGSQIIDSEVCHILLPCHFSVYALLNRSSMKMKAMEQGLME